MAIWLDAVEKELTKKDYLYLGLVSVGGKHPKDKKSQALKI